jgi:hypothetical protein
LKLILTLTTDHGEFVTQVVVETPEADLDLTDVEFSFRNAVANKAIAALQAEAKLTTAIKRYGGVMLPPGVC